MRFVARGFLGTLLLPAPASAASVVSAHALFDPAMPIERCVAAARNAVQGAGLRHQAMSS